MIDTHLHLWDLADPPAWLSPELAPLYQTYDPIAARTMHCANGYTRAVLVQVDNTRADTEHMLKLAPVHDWIIGVVGWVDLNDPSATLADVEARGTTSAGTGWLCGIRHLVHVDPRENFLDLPQVRESLAILARFDLPLDVPDAFPRHLSQVIELASEMPELTVVLDHLGKPPVDPSQHAQWRAQFLAAAELPNVVAKISGLHHGGIPLSETLAAEVMELALEAFTPARLMLGSDWPMPLLGKGVEALTSQRDAFLARIDSPAKEELAWITARRTYHLESDHAERN